MKKELLLIKVKAFASLKDFWTDDILELEVPTGADAKFILGALEKQLLQDSAFEGSQKMRLTSILSESVLASDQCILEADQTISESCDLAVLPPVCGG